MCGRYCSNRAAVVFNKNLKWLHMAGSVSVAPVKGDPGHTETRLSQTAAGVMRNWLYVWFSIWLISSSQDFRNAEMWEVCSFVTSPHSHWVLCFLCRNGSGSSAARGVKSGSTTLLPLNHVYLPAITDLLLSTTTFNFFILGKVNDCEKRELRQRSFWEAESL